MKYESTPEFTKDIQKLSKRFPKLIEDLEIAKEAVIELYHNHKIDNRSVFKLSCFANNKNIEI